MTEPEILADQRAAAEILTGWMAASAGAARRRSSVDARAFADMHELWRWLHQTMWRRGAGQATPASRP